MRQLGFGKVGMLSRLFQPAPIIMFWALLWISQLGEVLGLSHEHLLGEPGPYSPGKI